MFMNFLFVAYRRLILAPIYSLVNILGLSIGLTSFLLIMLYVNDELNYDKFWESADNIYQINTLILSAGNGSQAKYDQTFPQVAPLLQTAGSVKYAARMQTREFLANYEDKRYYEDINFVDPEFLNIFNFQFVEGSAQSALATPFSVILSKQDAEKYFDGQSALNKYITLDGKHQMRVSGVVKKLPGNTSLEIGLITSIDTLSRMYDESMLQQWQFPSMETYVLLNENEDTNNFGNYLNHLMKEHSPDNLTQQSELFLTSLGLVHVSKNELGGFNILVVLSAVSLLILVTACINMVNMTTAKSTERIREVGIRKALGSSRTELFVQVMTESLIMVFLSVIAALIFAELLLPWFNQVTYKNLYFDYFDSSLISQLILLNLVTGFISGLYPAVVISAYKPIDILKNDLHFGYGSLNFRTLLVLFQYVVAITMCIGSYNVILQLEHVKNADQGFEDNNIVVLSNLGWTDIRPLYSTIQSELLSHPNIESTAGSATVPGKEINRVGLFHVEGQSGVETSVSLNFLAVDFSFFETYKINLSSGRLFSKEYGADLIGSQQDSDTRPVYNIIVNQTALKTLGLPDEDSALGRRVISSDKRWGFDTRIVGIVNDFHLNVGEGELAPYIFLVAPHLSHYMSLRIKGPDIHETIKFIDQTWDRVVPQYPIVRSFLEDDLNAKYLSWQKNGELMVSLSVLAVLIALIGAIGLSTFSLRVKTKEISLRIVVGATINDLLKLFLWNFSKPLLVAIFIAFPLTFYILQEWLNNFVYRIDINLVNFVVTGLCSLVIVWIIISFYIMKVINTNPNQTLRHL